jgi:hypothetical protein
MFAQPLYIPEIKDPHVHRVYHDKFDGSQQGRCNKEAQNTIYNLVCQTRETGDPQVHVMLCFSGAELARANAVALMRQIQALEFGTQRIPPR